MIEKRQEVNEVLKYDKACPCCGIDDAKEIAFDEHEVTLKCNSCDAVWDAYIERWQQNKEYQAFEDKKNKGMIAKPVIASIWGRAKGHRGEK